jgi:2-C-methyl-D-erythritol 2,4-cyclodiphosphate synthase
MRIGFGYDVHRLVEGRKLILGGVEIPYEKGLLGHSDADVLIHALIDAILGALALGDIGKLFPDNEQTYKDIDSRILLRKTCELMKEKGFAIGNADLTVCLQEPKLRDHIDRMRVNLASDLETNIDNVSIKATTEEGLGISGSKEGVCCYASVLVQQKG